MSLFIRIALAVFAIGYYVGCNKVKFDKDLSNDPCQASVGCAHVNGRDQYTDNVTAGLGKVDILFVDDNSGSMSFEQKRMADRFSSFIQTLDAKNVDYRIAVTTTDISSADNPARGINQNGALQDGKLIQFADGTYFLSKSVGTAQNRQDWFSQVIKRSETSNCETFIANNPMVSQSSSQYNDNCPSGDERAIYAANLTVQNNPASFIRADASLAIIILSDEDVRSSNYYKSNSFALSSQDLPQTLIDGVKAKYTSKTLSVHSLIVKPGAVQAATLDQVSAMLNSLTSNPVAAHYDPTTYFTTGDQSCLNAQSNQIPGSGFSGSYGYLYALLTRLTGGVEGNICASDYGSQLVDIGSTITDHINDLSLRCADPKDITVVISPNLTNISYSVDGSTLKFTSTLPPGTQVTAVYSCPSQI